MKVMRMQIYGSATNVQFIKGKFLTLHFEPKANAVNSRISIGVFQETSLSVSDGIDNFFRADLEEAAEDEYLLLVVSVLKGGIAWVEVDDHARVYVDGGTRPDGTSQRLSYSRSKGLKVSELKVKEKAGKKKLSKKGPQRARKRV